MSIINGQITQIIEFYGRNEVTLIEFRNMCIFHLSKFLMIFQIVLNLRIPVSCIKLSFHQRYAYGIKFLISKRYAS